MQDATDSPASNPAPRFFTVDEAAAILRTSKMTLYRSIAANKFPAIRIRNRLIIPAKAIDEMEAAALENQSVVDAADWVDPTID